MGGWLLRVGYDKRSYPVQRNILSAATEFVAFVRVKNLFRYPNYALFRVFNYVDPLLDNVHWSRSGVIDLLQLFNSVSLGKTPWVSTYETSIPRWHWPDLNRGKGEFALRRMAAPACKRLIAMSASADRIQRHFLSEQPAYRDEITPKLTILHPPQRLISTAITKPLVDGAFLQGAIVGSQFFCKGGLEVLRSVRDLLNQGAPLKLIIVSDLDSSDYLTHTTEDQVTEALKIIEKHGRNIVRFSKLPNSEVLQIFCQSHFALLPSCGDSYGYSLLEAQACGCPVVTTNVRALSEINNDVCGWICEMPLNEFGAAILKNNSDRMRFSEELEARIRSAMFEILESPGLLARKAGAAVERIARDHDPARFAAALRRI